MIIPCCDDPGICHTITWLFDTLPNAETETEYSQQLYAIGVTSPAQYLILSGSLPPGLTLSREGIISGEPALNGEYEFTVQVSDKNRCTSSKTYTLTVDFPEIYETEDEMLVISEIGEFLILE